jgi:hypothetical protein
MPELLKAVPFPNGSVESEALRWFDDIQLDGLWVPESKLQTFPDPPMGAGGSAWDLLSHEIVPGHVVNALPTQCRRKDSIRSIANGEAMKGCSRHEGPPVLYSEVCTVRHVVPCSCFAYELGYVCAHVALIKLNLSNMVG